MSGSKNSKKDQAKALAKIDQNLPNVDENEKINAANKYIATCRKFLQINGVAKSRAAIADSVVTSGDSFGVTELVDSLRHFGFKAQFGYVKIDKRFDDFLPAIIFDAQNQPFLVTKNKNSETYDLVDADSKVSTLDQTELKKLHANYAIIAKKLSASELADLDGHWFFSAFKTKRFTYFQIAIAALVSNILGLSTTIFIITVYDRILPNSAMDSLVALAIGVSLAVLIDFAIKSVRAKLIDSAGWKADRIVSKRVFNKILDADLSSKDSRTGALANVVKEFELLRDIFNSSTFVILIDFPFALLFIYVIWILGGPIAYVPLATIAVVLLTSLAAQPFLARLSKRASQDSMSKQSVLIEALTGIETIKTTNSGNLMRARYEQSVAAEADINNRSKGIAATLLNVTASATQYSQIGTIIVGVLLVKSGDLTAGGLIGAMVLSGKALQPVGQLTNLLSKANRAIDAYRRLSAIMSAKSQKDLGSSVPLSKASFKGEIELKNVSFQYTGTNMPVITDLNLKIPPGQKVAILGKMGSGKTTILKLIAGVFKPNSGAVLLDGYDNRQIDTSDLYENVGVMQQESWLFSGTLRENILMDKLYLTENDLLEASKISTLDNMVSNIQQGFDYYIKENGKGLSGGQRQCISLTRAVIGDPKILVLDEPTSALDQGSEQKIVENLQGLIENRTLVCVTHRNAILSIVDRVLIVENGKITMDTTPEKLGVAKKK